MEKSFTTSLFVLRLGVLVVLVMWNLDKFVNPGHTGAVFNKFYLIPGLQASFSYGVGGLQGLVLLMFALGLKKTLSYGAVFAMHAVSTLSTWQMYLDPWGPRNLLFFAAWPMLAAVYVLYVHRESDTMFNWRPRN